MRRPEVQILCFVILLFNSLIDIIISVVNNAIEERSEKYEQKSS